MTTFNGDNNPNLLPGLVVGPLLALGDDTINGLGGDDLIVGYTGNDVLSGGKGADILLGGVLNVALNIGTFSLSGEDTADYTSSDAAVTVDLSHTNEIAVSALGINLDLLGASVGHGGDAEGDILVGITDLNGSQFGDTLTGNADGNVLKGYAGDDTLSGGDGNDVMFGGSGTNVMDGGVGDDRFNVDSATDIVYEATAQGTDRVFASVSYRLMAGQSVEILATNARGGTAAIDLTGNELAQTIQGNAGDNVLTGGGGLDTLYGYDGNDTYHVSDAHAHVLEAVGEGADTVQTSVSYSLSHGQSVEFLMTEATTGTDAINLRGNELTQQIEGNAGANILISGGGADTMIGHAGNDTYMVSSTNAHVYEVADQGSDTVFASTGFSLDADQSIEVLATNWRLGTMAINLTGNDLDQSIQGNAGVNVLTGNGGADTLSGFGGADSMSGGEGNDLYYVSDSAAHVYEAVGQGADTVFSSVSFSLDAGQSVEMLATSSRLGHSAITLVGNELDQRIDGNEGNNGLYGGDGADTLNGFGGNDVMSGGNGHDVLNGGAGNNTFAYAAVQESTGANRDLIQYLNFANDKFDFGAVPTAVDAKVTIGSLSTATFDSDLSHAIDAAHLGAGDAVLFDPNGGDLNVSGHMFLVIDANGVAGYQAGQDYVVELQNASGTLTLDNFV